MKGSSESKTGISTRIGVDLVRIERFKDLSRDSPFCRRVFVKAELDYCFSYPDPAPHLATTFAGKEAAAKALGSEVHRSFQQIRILRSKDGVPFCFLDFHKRPVLISLSHTSEYAVAVAMQACKDSSILQESLNDAVQELKLELGEGHEST